MEEDRQPRALRRGKVSAEKIKRDPGLQLQEYLSRTASAEETLFMINELLFSGQNQGTRKNVRAPVSVPVTFRLGSTVHRASSYTLSQRGMFIKFPDPPVPGTVMELEFALPDNGEAIKTGAEVVQSADLEEAMKRSSISGMSVVFTDISREHRKRIEMVVRGYLKKVPKALR
jgi:hypothetical protein